MRGQEDMRSVNFSELEKSDNFFTKVLFDIGKFYKKSDRWYIEGAKHLVPSYNTSRALNYENGFITMGGVLIDLFEIGAYLGIAVYLVDKVR